MAATTRPNPRSMAVFARGGASPGVPPGSLGGARYPASTAGVNRRRHRGQESPGSGERPRGLKCHSTPGPVLLDATMRPDICSARDRGPADLDWRFPVHDLRRDGVASSQDPRCLLATSTGLGGSRVEPSRLDHRGTPRGVVLDVADVLEDLLGSPFDVCSDATAGDHWHLLSCAPIDGCSDCPASVNPGLQLAIQRKPASTTRAMAATTRLNPLFMAILIGGRDDDGRPRENHP